MVGVAELPATFRLQAADLDLDVWAKLVWHSGEDAGVRFKRMETRDCGGWRGGAMIALERTCSGMSSAC